MLCIWQPVSGTHRKRLSSQGSAHPPERSTRSPNPDPRSQAPSIVLSSSLHRQQGQPCPSSGPGHLPQPQGQEGLSCSTHTGTGDPSGKRKGSTGPGSKGRMPVLARLWGEVGGQNSHPLAPREAPNPQARQPGHLPQGRLESAIILLKSQEQIRQLWKCPPNAPSSRRRQRRQACLQAGCPQSQGVDPSAKAVGTPSLASPTPSPDKQWPPLRRLQGPREDRAYRALWRGHFPPGRAAQSPSERAGQRGPQPAEGCKQSPRGLVR